MDGRAIPSVDALLSSPAVRELCERYVAVGFTKLVLVPFSEPADWDDELAAGAQAVLPIQN